MACLDLLYRNHSHIATPMDGLYSYLAVGSILAFVIYSLFLDPLRKVPGPFLARWSRLWIIYHSRAGDMHTKMMALHKQYGKLVRTAPNEVSVADPAALKTIYGVFFVKVD